MPGSDGLKESDERDMFGNNSDGDCDNLRPVDVQRPRGVAMTAVLLVALGLFAGIGIVAAGYWFACARGRMMRDMDNHD